MVALSRTGAEQVEGWKKWPIWGMCSPLNFFSSLLGPAGLGNGSHYVSMPVWSEGENQDDFQVFAWKLG